MVEQVTFQTIFQFLQTVGILVGVYYYITTIRSTRKNQEMQLETRQAQLFIQLYNRFHEESFWEKFNELRWDLQWEDYEDFMKRYSTDRSKMNLFNSLMCFFEGIGVLVKRDLLDVKIVDDLMSVPVLAIWDKYGPVILEWRRRMDSPTTWEYFEYLFIEVKKVAEVEHGAAHIERLDRLHAVTESSSD